jgi:hypothetical protein
MLNTKKARTIDLVAKIAGVNGRSTLVIVRKMARNQNSIVFSDRQTLDVKGYGISVGQTLSVAAALKYMAHRLGVTTSELIEDAAQDDNRPPTPEEAVLCHSEYSLLFRYQET